MKRIIYLLSGLLLVQLLVAGGLFWQERQQSRLPAAEPLLAFELETLDQLTLEDGQGVRLTLQQRDGRWQLPDYHDLPVSAAKLDALFERLEQARADWPVATTESGRQRFEVAEQNFQRKLSFQRDGELQGALYLGTSPGFKQTHVRLAGHDEVYAIELESHQLALQPERWFDAGLLSPAEPVTRLAGEGFSLRKHDDGWRADGEQQPVTEQLDQLLQALNGLRVEAVAEPSDEAVEPAFQLRVGSDQQQHRYRFYRDGEQYMVERDDQPLRFRLAQHRFERLSGFTADQLLAAPTGATDADPNGERSAGVDAAGSASASADQPT
ncbi:DUF4340 domain-containing protein [Marinobacterium arenosum]|uniref:DUF4340 domain-containing protein n=1 Tax=Marinobacterium arenosum TaxID=2862496 RepID=UPI001C95FDBB|nr:DUF4340 domain-containing protein [Marinobacterium arenosum]MBY4677028.1 DUF4340 domain-containing protein [Marinobacterium arenosum]